jgi:hypothetical protein
MRLIVELYTHNQIPEDIIITCITSLLEEINDQNIEILCQMLEKISNHVVRRAIRERDEIEQPVGNSAEKPKGRKKLSIRNHSINLDYAESIIKSVFEYR